MSQLLHLELTLEQVVAMATIHPARIINRVLRLGTLQVGAPGDVTLLELVEQPGTSSWAAIPTASRSHSRRRSTDGKGGCVAVGTAASPFEPTVPA